MYEHVQFALLFNTAHSVAVFYFPLPPSLKMVEIKLSMGFELNGEIVNYWLILEC